MSQSDINIVFTEYLLSFSCPDRLGVVAKQSSFFFEFGAYITEIDVYTDPLTQKYFSRCVFDDRELKISIDEFKEKFYQLATKLDMDYQLRPVLKKPKLLIAVSKYDHCLNALLNKWKSGALRVDILGVLSNHNDCKHIAESYGLNYYHLPITKETKPQQEERIMSLMTKHEIDLLVLARYMQILSDDLCNNLAGKAINIHHSFLPGFKGAKPYHQAFDRGVKLIGATCHYVTSDLDEGPIIDQDIQRVNHSDQVEDLVRLGKDIEKQVLARGLRYHLEDRIMVDGNKTIIF